MGIAVRGYGIHPDTLALAFQRQRPHETNDCRLGGTVGRLAVVGIQAGAGGGENHPPIALCEKLRPQRVQQVQVAKKAGVKDGAKVGQALLGKAAGFVDAGIGHHNVYAAQLSHEVFLHLQAAVGLADVAPVGISLAPRRPNSVYGLLGGGLCIALSGVAAVVHQYPRALAGQ